MSKVRIEDAPETAKALRKECDNCSCFKDQFMCNLGPCQNIKAANLLDAQDARIAELETKLAESEKKYTTLFSECQKITRILCPHGATDIESVLEAATKVTMERDAAVLELSKYNHCSTCKHLMLDDGNDICLQCYETKDRWEWSGPCAENTAAR